MNKLLCAHRFPLHSITYANRISYSSFKIVNQALFNNCKYFCSDNKSEGSGKQKNEGQQSISQQKQQKIIQISKQQYNSMRRLLQDIQLSMPDLGITFPEKSISSSQATSQNSSHFAPNNQTQPKQNKQMQAQKYFSTAEQILSFKLLKLSQPQQFASVLQQHKNSEDCSIKLLILHRYCSVGGIMNGKSLSANGAQKLAYRYMQDLLVDMNRLQQNQVCQLAQLYLTLRKQEAEENSAVEDAAQGKQVSNVSKILQTKLQVPPFDPQAIPQSSLPLCANPSHSSTRILVLLMQLWQINLQNKQKYAVSKLLKKGMARILKHYQLGYYLARDEESVGKTGNAQLNQKHELKDLAYIGVSACVAGMEDYNAIPIFIEQIKQLSAKPQASSNKQLIEAGQHMLQHIYKLNNCSPPILSQIDALKQTYLQAIIAICNQTHSQPSQPPSQQQQKMLTHSFSTGSTTIPALLHSSLVVIQHNRNRISSQFAASLASAVLANVKSIPTHSLTLQQYGEYWQSAMVMYKLIKNGYKHDCLQHHEMYRLVDNFINGFNVEEYVRENANVREGEYVVQENLENTQSVLFDCLVAYRMIVTPQLNKVVLGRHTRNGGNQLASLIQEAEQNDKQKGQLAYAPAKHRKVIKQLISGYRKTVQTLNQCGLISSPQDIAIHNLIICCMIAEAYSKNTRLSLAEYLLTPNIRELLSEFGSQHSKYGQYVAKVMAKYGNY